VAALLNGWLVHADGPKGDLPIPKGTVKELVRIESKGFIPFYAIAPDGKTLAYCEAVSKVPGKPADCELILLDLITGKEPRRRPADATGGGVFSADGKWLAVGNVASPTALTVWDVARWEPKVKLKRPQGYVFGWPLGFSPDGKIVVGRCQAKHMRSLFVMDDLVLWDVATGDHRILEIGEAKFVGGGFGPGCFLVEKDGRRVGLLFPPSGGPFVGFQPMAISFPDHGKAEQLFVEYHAGSRVFTTLWDVTKGKPLRTDSFGGGWAGGINRMQYSGLAGRGAPVPGSRADLFRFRTTPSSRILQLPKYHLPSVIAVSYDDGTIGVAVNRYPFPELCRLEDYKDTAGRTCWLTPDGRRLVAVGIDPTAAKKKKEVVFLRVWDVSALHPIAVKKMKKLAGDDRELLWSALFEDHPDPETANVLEFAPARYSLALQAMASLVLHGENGIPWLEKKLGPPFDLKHAPQLVKDLDSPEFKKRHEASQQLAGMGHAAAPFLKNAKDLSPEGQKRVHLLLNKLKGTAVAYELRYCRIIDVLEHINTAPARALLKLIADGKYDPTFADEARKALKRATKKS
jgi:hypothetical protein